MADTEATVERIEVSFAFALTLDELQETLYPPLDRKGRPVRRWLFQRVLWALAMVVCACVGLAQLWFDASGRAGSPGVANPDNLWITLIPSLVPALEIVVGWGLVPASRTIRNPIGRRLAFELSGLLVMAIFFGGIQLILQRQWIVYWRPSPAQAAAVAFSPWFALLVVGLARGIRQPRRLARKIWKGNPGIRRTQAVHATVDALEVRDELSTEIYRWGYFRRFVETPNLLVLHLEDGRVLGLPKRALGNEVDHFALRRLLHERVKTGTFLPQQPGFAVIPTVIPASTA